ncbi:MAG: AMP-binding protein, partial [Acidobacteria bacterium]|nr:AMP-binding protein [Acidobacteriota bacterium]
NVLANVDPFAQQIRPYLKYERLVHPIRFLCLLPLSHVFGQFLSIFLPPLLRGTVCFVESLKPAEIIQTIRRQRISVLVAVPRMLQSLQEKLEWDLENSGSAVPFRRTLDAAKGRHWLRRWWIFRRVHRQFGWKFWALISGGASLGDETEEFWTTLGFAVIQGYGLTETTSLISVNHPFQVGKGSVGKILAGREVKLAPDGEILVRGGGIASSYWSAAGAEPVASAEGWYHTGDIGELDRQGNLFFKGRKKEVIITSAGMNVYPEDLERVVKKQSGVIDCVVVSLAVDRNAEPCAVLILRADSPGPDGVIAQANQELADYQRIRRFMVWPDLDFPRTATAKPRRQQIAESVQKCLKAGSSPGSSSQKPLHDLISRIAKRQVLELLKETRLDSDLNLSSLDRVELLSALEDRYHLPLSETQFSAAGTVGEIEQMLAEGPVPRGVFHYPAWAQHWPVTWIRFIVHYLLLRPAVFFLGWPKIAGRENLAQVDGPVLIISNHVGHVDVGFIVTALPARIRHKLATAAGGEALEALRTPPSNRHFLARLYDRVEWALGVALLNLFPLPRQAGFRESFTFVGQSVDRGQSILVFPEGHHTTNGKLLPFRAGVGLLVNNLGIPVVPMRIDGLFEVKQAGKRIARPHQIQVKIGKPITFSTPRDPQEIAAELENLVARL